MTVGFTTLKVNESFLTTCCSETTVTLHLQSPVSVKIVFVKFSLTVSGPLSKLYLALPITVVPSGTVQVMVAGGLLSRPVPQTRENLSPNNAYYRVGPGTAKDGPSVYN